MAQSKWRKLKYPERNRIYHFFDAESREVAVEVANVTALRVSPSGTHYLEYGNQEKMIIKNTWFALKIEADRWSF